MRSPVLAALGVLLLLFGYSAAPAVWPTEDVLPNLLIQIALWLSAGAGVLCLLLAVVDLGPDTASAEDDSAGRPRAA